MAVRGDWRGMGPIAAGLIAAMLGGCQSMQTASIGQPKIVAAPTVRDKDCLTRGMYFEANRSDDDGLLAVGTVIMNRLNAHGQPDSICGVVGAPRQFAHGVLTKPMSDGEKARVERVAVALLAGKRHQGVRNAQHFHVAGRSYRYPNMHYVAATGGNRFYEKTDKAGNHPATLPEAVVHKGAGVVPVKLAFAEILPETSPASGPEALLKAIQN